MLAQWTCLLPHFVVVWLTKKYAMRVNVVPGYLSANPFEGEIFSWPEIVGSSRYERDVEIDEHQLEGDLRHDLRDISFGGRG